MYGNSPHVSSPKHFLIEGELFFRAGATVASPEFNLVDGSGGRDPRVRASARADTMSLPTAPHNCLSSSGTTYHGIPPSKRKLTPLRHAVLLTRRSLI
jgi:hypothetical protein